MNIIKRNTGMNIIDFADPESEKEFEMFPVHSESKIWSEGGFVTACVEA